MNESTENRTSGAFEGPSRQDLLLTWAAANRMLPLVQQITSDVLKARAALAKMQTEKDRLDYRRRELDWPERSRRYQLQEEIVREEARLCEGLAELQDLGLTWVDAEQGHVGFPTMVNKRKAFFSWRPGEERLAHWVYVDDNERRAVPVGWMKTETPSARTK